MPLTTEMRVRVNREEELRVNRRQLAQGSFKAWPNIPLIASGMNPTTIWLVSYVIHLHFNKSQICSIRSTTSQNK